MLRRDRRARPLAKDEQLRRTAVDYMESAFTTFRTCQSNKTRLPPKTLQDVMTAFALMNDADKVQEQQAIIAATPENDT